MVNLPDPIQTITTRNRTLFMPSKAYLSSTSVSFQYASPAVVRRSPEAAVPTTLWILPMDWPALTISPPASLRADEGI